MQKQLTVFFLVFIVQATAALAQSLGLGPVNGDFQKRPKSKLHQQTVAIYMNKPPKSGATVIGPEFYSRNFTIKLLQSFLDQCAKKIPKGAHKNSKNNVEVTFTLNPDDYVIRFDFMSMVDAMTEFNECFADKMATVIDKNPS